MSNQAMIVKANGDKELFVEEKLRTSLQRCKATPDEIEKVVAHINDELEDGTTTDHIYRHAFHVLKTLENHEARRKYSLRRALLEFGPTGFPFEKYLAALFKEKGYEISLNQTVLGTCVSHEMDVVAWNDEKLMMIEAKFHNQVGEKSDLKVILYIKARFDDLLDQTFDYGHPRLLDEGWLITNTKFTENAIKYGECAKVRMIGWNYPKKGNLENMIEDTGLHPITCLSTLNNFERQLLLNKGVVLCRQVKGLPKTLEEIGSTQAKIAEVQAEAELICQPYGL